MPLLPDYSALRPEEAVALMRKYDADNSGEMEWAEFANLLRDPKLVAAGVTLRIIEEHARALAARAAERAAYKLPAEKRAAFLRAANHRLVHGDGKVRGCHL